MLPLSDAKNISLDASGATLPNMQDAIVGWLQPMTFVVVTKSIVGFENSETQTTVSFNGVWQPMSAQALQLKPEGQRAWIWYTVHATTNLVLSVDDIVTYLGINYRVMTREDYSLYGYIKYDLVQDWTTA